MAEFENGFRLWVSKMVQLAMELSIPTTIFCNAITRHAIEKCLKTLKVANTPIKYTDFNDWDDFLILGKYIDKDDLFVLISARKGATSYNSNLDKIPQKIERHFAENSRIVIYPQQNSAVGKLEQYSDFSPESINKGLETAQ